MLKKCNPKALPCSAFRKEKNISLPKSLLKNDINFLPSKNSITLFEHFSSRVERVKEGLTG